MEKLVSWFGGREAQTQAAFTDPDLVIASNDESVVLGGLWEAAAEMTQPPSHLTLNMSLWLMAL